MELNIKEINELNKMLKKHCANKPSVGCFSVNCYDCVTRQLVDNGYRKQSDVAKEIHDKIEKLIKRYCGIETFIPIPGFDDIFREYGAEV